MGNMELSYSNELNALIRELIDKAAPAHVRDGGTYARRELTEDVLYTLKYEYPERYLEFSEVSDLKGILLKVNSRLSSTKIEMNATSPDGEEAPQMRLNLNIPVAGRRDGDVKSIYDCRLREVMLDAMKREEKIAAHQEALKEERAVIKHMIEAGASMDDYVRDFFRQAA